VNIPENVKVSLGAGDQVLKIVYKEFLGDASFRLHWKPPGQNNFTPIPPNLLYYRADTALQPAQQDRPLALP
jgi:hypothetical protein